MQQLKLLPFPVLADYGFLLLGGRAVYLTHGHVINKAHPLPFAKGDILLHGRHYAEARDLRPRSTSLLRSASLTRSRWSMARLMDSSLTPLACRNCRSVPSACLNYP